MEKRVHKWGALLSALVICLLSLVAAAGFFTPKKEMKASAATYSSYPYTIDRYDVDATITEDRKIVVVEEFQITVYEVGPQKVFYKSLPLEGDRYQDLWAKGVGNPLFSYEVADNPDVSGFIDINCKGGVEVGAVLTYQFGYTLLIAGEDFADGMILDFVGAGTTVPIRNATVDIDFPAPLDGEPTIYSDSFGGSGNQYVDVVEIGEKSLHLEADLLPITYSERFGEYCAAPITVSFKLQEGGMQSYKQSLWDSKGLWPAIGFSAALVAVGLLCFLLIRKRKEITTVVNLTAPDQMDPLQMGALLDGKVDGEDVTAMIYYFAEKGYLKISFEDEKNPTLHKVKDMEEEAPAYQRVLFDGLFKGSTRSVDIDSLKGDYYQYVDRAKTLVANKTSVLERYEKKSVAAVVTCLIFTLLFSLVVPIVMGRILLHESYLYLSFGFTLLFCLSAALVGVCLFYAKELRYKGKGGARRGLLVAAFFVTLIGVLIAYVYPSHVLSQLENAIICLGGIVCIALGVNSLTISEKHAETLGQILGFKEFIVVTEEDKIKLMLEENPQAYYHILPYAQVLGVTREWEEKFKGLTLQPPTWYVGESLTFFDYYILSRSLRLMSFAMVARPQPTGGIGRSGGGGGFGGFAGGGHGGGGFGMR